VVFRQVAMQTDGVLKVFECKQKIDSKQAFLVIISAFLIVILAFLVVFPEGDLLLFVAFAFIFTFSAQNRMSSPKTIQIQQTK
jgi:hypothetical protein